MLKNIIEVASASFAQPRGAIVLFMEKLLGLGEAMRPLRKHQILFARNTVGLATFRASKRNDTDGSASSTRWKTNVAHG